MVFEMENPLFVIGSVYENSCGCHRNTKKCPQVYYFPDFGRITAEGE